MAATDPYGSEPAVMPYPARNAEAITPSDTTEFSHVSRGIYIGVTGDVVAVMPDDTAITFKNAVQGSVIPVVAKRVNATSTTATDLVALW
jgi:hypothetical protein